MQSCKILCYHVKVKKIILKWDHMNRIFSDTNFTKLEKFGRIVKKYIKNLLPNVFQRKFQGGHKKIKCKIFWLALQNLPSAG